MPFLSPLSTFSLSVVLPSSLRRCDVFLLGPLLFVPPPQESPVAGRPSQNKSGIQGQNGGRDCHVDDSPVCERDWTRRLSSKSHMENRKINSVLDNARSQPLSRWTNCLVASEPMPPPGFRSCLPVQKVRPAGERATSARVKHILANLQPATTMVTHVAPYSKSCAGSFPQLIRIVPKK